MVGPLSRSSVMECRNPHLAVLAAAKDGLADCHAESFVVPQGVADCHAESFVVPQGAQDMKDALTGALAEQGR